MTTNYERIKNMTGEEMAEFFSTCFLCYECPVFKNCDFENVTIDECSKVLEQWLKSESEV